MQYTYNYTIVIYIYMKLIECLFIVSAHAAVTATSCGIVVKRSESTWLV